MSRGPQRFTKRELERAIRAAGDKRAIRIDPRDGAIMILPLAADLPPAGEPNEWDGAAR